MQSFSVLNDLAIGDKAEVTVQKGIGEQVLYDVFRVYFDGRKWLSSHAAAGLTVHPSFQPQIVKGRSEPLVLVKFNALVGMICRRII